MVESGSKKFNLKTFSLAISAGAFLSAVNIWNTERYWRIYEPTVSGDNLGFQGSPLHFATRGLLTSSFFEWLGYLLLASVLVWALSARRVSFYRTLAVCVVSFAAGAVVWDAVIDLFDVGVLRGGLPM